MPSPRPTSALSPLSLLAGMRIRKKLIVLHTFFSLLLVAILVVALRPAVEHVVEEAEAHDARLAVEIVRARVAGARAATGRAIAIDTLAADLPAGVSVRRAPPEYAAITPPPRAAGSADDDVVIRPEPAGVSAAFFDRDPASPDASGVWYVATVTLTDARAGVVRMYILLSFSLLGVYALIAAALELFVLPRHVYGPIHAMLQADRAAQDGDSPHELVPDRLIPRDELGEIMRSRNATILALRTHQRELAHTLSELASTATDLKRKNHLLETARRNLADADRLASLGMMSAGLAHELNTPLAVAKGLVEKLNARPDKRLDEPDAALLVRVVGRLERLSESLLDFARARPHTSEPAHLRPLVEEAWTLVRLDRDARAADVRIDIDPALVLRCSPDRLVQVFVNLLRNAADATGRPASAALPPAPRVAVAADAFNRDGRRWVAITITDDGPGIDPAIVGRLFEPFATTRMDAKGTGLGLAVSDGIIRDHGGLLTARNRDGAPGAVFEILLPADEPAPSADAPNAPALPVISRAAAPAGV